MNILLPKNHYFYDNCYEKSVVKKKKVFLFHWPICYMSLVLESGAFKTHFGYCSCHELNMTVTQRNVSWYDFLQNIKSTAGFLFLSILKILRLA